MTTLPLHKPSNGSARWSHMHGNGVQLCRYLFTATGINACSYSMKVAGVYTIAFTVTNSQGLSASVNRTLMVEPVCPLGQILCSNKVNLEHLHSVETHFYCPQTFLSLDSQCRDEVSELKLRRIGIEKSCAATIKTHSACTLLCHAAHIQIIDACPCCVNIHRSYSLFKCKVKCCDTVDLPECAKA